MEKAKRNNTYLISFLFLLILLTAIGGSSEAAYRLNQDDILGVTVWGHEEITAEVVVGPDGMVSLPLIGNVEVAGLTIGELDIMLTEEYANYLKDPEVNIILKEYRKTRVMVLGEVQKPGTYPLEEDRRVLEVISLAGGPTDVAALDQIRLTRGEEVRNLDLEGVRKGTAVEDNFMVKEGDVIYIPEGVVEAVIMGEVKQPGRYQLEKGLKITDLIAMSGGPTKNAAFELEYISSGITKKYLVRRLLNGTEKNIPVLEDGDVVFIDEGEFEVSILGEVQRPGTYVWNEKMRLTDLIARAGNETEYGDLKEVKVIHYDNSTEFYNLNKFFKEGDMDNNPYIQQGDSVYVSRGDFEVTVLGEVRQPGSYPWKEELRLTDLLAVAGNQTETGDLSQVKVTRHDGGSHTVDFNKYLETGSASANPVLEPGDSVYINKKIFEISILGEVNKPGIYSWHEGIRLDKLLAQAGNETERGNMKKVQILHDDGTSSEVNLENYLQGSTDNEENPLLKPGDTVKIEEVNTIDWEKVFNYVAGANLIKELFEIEW